MSHMSQAWSAALSAEQQACFGYALTGAYVGAGTASGLARTCQRAHEVLRDSAAAAISEAGDVPSPPMADYPSVYPVRDPGSARRLAVRLEQDAAAAWRYLYAVAADATGPAAGRARTTAQAALTASAVRATKWRVLLDPATATTAFPGL